MLRREIMDHRLDPIGLLQKYSGIGKVNEGNLSKSSTVFIRINLVGANIDGHPSVRRRVLAKTNHLELQGVCCKQYQLPRKRHSKSKAAT